MSEAELGNAQDRLKEAKKQIQIVQHDMGRVGEEYRGLELVSDYLDSVIDYMEKPEAES